MKQTADVNFCLVSVQLLPKMLEQLSESFPSDLF